jgi:hypothetical protein
MRALAEGSFRTVPGESFGTPKELWGFRSPRGKGSARRIATDFLDANRAHLGIDRRRSGVELQRSISSLGAEHLIFQQILFGRRVHRAYVTVHVGRDKRVYMTKNRALPVEMLPGKPEFEVSVSDAIRRARKALGPSGGAADLHGTEEMWFFHAGKMKPVHRVRLVRSKPRQEWIVYVNARTGGLVSKYDNLARARGRARVFDPSPVTELGGHEALLTPAKRPRKPPGDAYREVTLYGLKSNGRLEGKRVTTKPTAPSRRVRKTDRRFLLESTQTGFEEVMVYYHVDAALRYLERLGFRGSRAIFTSPVRADVNGTRDDNSWYSPGNRLLTFGSGGVDDAEDGETILHELGHAIQDAICPDFGQSDEAAAMGEGFGDYFACSFFADKKPERYQPVVMAWDGLTHGLEAGIDPPGLRRVDEPWTYDDFIEGDDEHDNGEIWSATLWDVRSKLGGTEADRLILESHFQLDGFTTFARGARAILDADRNLNEGAGESELRKVFERRRIGPI